MKTYRIAVIPGDGIGKEVVPEGIRVLDAVAAKFGIGFTWDAFDWSCETYLASGSMMPEDGIAQISGHDAIFLGAVGFPGRDHKASGTWTIMPWLNRPMLGMNKGRWLRPARI